ncbi:MAG: undecaprenyl-diphosphate phosphatase [bacterium]
MELWQAIVLGIVEGITEFLPISSTGHLILASHIMGIPQNEFVKTFQIFIQFGAILAVIVLYFKKLVKNIEIWKRIIIAFIPTGILGLIFYKFIKNYLIGNDVVVVFALITGGIILIIADRYSGKFFRYSEIEKMGFWEVFIIGVFQSLAMVPGVSRSGATIIGGMFMGFDRKTAAEFSFLLAIPTMLTASSFDLVKSYHSFGLQDFHILMVGFVVSFITALLTVKALVNFLSKNSFLGFGIYRIILASIYAKYFIF